MSSDCVIEYASHDDLTFLVQADSYVRALGEKVSRREVLIARANGFPIGWLRFSYFWDTIPFMDMLFVLAAHRGQGVGTRLVSFWETAMLEMGHRRVLTSTQADETAQHFYRQLGYVDVGRFILPGESSEELLLHKTLR